MLYFLQHAAFQRLFVAHLLCVHIVFKQYFGIPFFQISANRGTDSRIVLEANLYNPQFGSIFVPKYTEYRVFSSSKELFAEICFLSLPFFFVLIVSILPLKYQSQMTNPLIFSNARMTSSR